MEKGELIVSHCGGHIGHANDPDMDEEISAMIGSGQEEDEAPTVNEEGMIDAMLVPSKPKKSEEDDA